MLKARFFYSFIICVVIYWLVALKLEILESLNIQKPIRNIANKSTPAELRQNSNTSNAEYNEKLSCPTGPAIAVVYDGYMNFGNQLWSYAVAWALSKSLNRPAFASKIILDKMKLIFPNLSLLPLEDFNHCKLKNFKALNSSLIKMGENLTEQFKNENLRVPVKAVIPELLLPLLEEIREKEFKFHNSVMYKMRETIRLVGGHSRVIVAVHVRRKHYDQYLYVMYRKLPAHSSYYLDAMDWYQKYISKGKLLFLIVSDDVAWCRKNKLDEREDVISVSQDEGHDLALLSMADHNIIDYGAFGMWGGLVTKGSTVTLLNSYYNGIMAKYKDWHMLDESTYMKRAQL
ncbi:Hypothetical predicted protein [Cloeon dipterum]|uniref:L-Fucosyltransferase n=1 Tax=Cloeon dipterum TaxID=197152 RepID=A0A8S1BTS0_9INSE|nr:Hypothetical predicted protein [Cloeon dipterum]